MLINKVIYLGSKCLTNNFMEVLNFQKKDNFRDSATGFAVFIGKINLKGLYTNKNYHSHIYLHNKNSTFLSSLIHHFYIVSKFFQMIFYTDLIIIIANISIHPYFYLSIFPPSSYLLSITTPIQCINFISMSW